MTRGASEVGSGIHAPEGVWSFGGDTPLAFEEHVRQSIPRYEECHQLILDLAEQVCPLDGRCYDLGCSTGVLTRQLEERLRPRHVEVIGVDRDAGMIEQARRADTEDAGAPVFEVAAVETMAFQPADLVVCFYTMQFVPVRDRLGMLTRLREALSPGGALILFDKTVAGSGREHDLDEGVYVEFKRRNGFSNSEIVEKRRSLRGVLRPLTAAENLALLRRAGFTEIMHVFRWLMFDGLVAWAEPAGPDSR